VVVHRRLPACGHVEQTMLLRGMPRTIMLSEVHDRGSEDARKEADQAADAGKEQQQQQEHRYAAAPRITGDQLKIGGRHHEQSREAEDGPQHAANLQAATRRTGEAMADGHGWD